jgi:hypothetical protein
MQYKINVPITVRYLATDNQTGLTDLSLIATNPSGADQSPITFSEIGDGLYTANFTPDVIGWWLVRVSCVSNPKNIYSKSYFVGTEYTTYPPQENGKLTSIDTKVGEVQSSPTQYTLLGRLKDLYDKLIDLFTNGLAKVKLWDGSNVASVDSQGRLYVYIPPTQNNITVQLCWDGSITPVKAVQWNDALSYTVPTGYDLNCIQFDGLDNVNGGAVRAANKLSFGSFVLSTGVFTDGSAWTLPKFASKLSVYVTTIVGATNDTITITYTNQAGTTGRTASVILKSNVVGERIDVPLQAGDFGVIDVTNVTQSFAEAGAINVEGFYELFHQELTTNGVQYSEIAPLSSIVVIQGDTVYLQYKPSNAATAIRRVSLIGALVPR